MQFHHPMPTALATSLALPPQRPWPSQRPMVVAHRSVLVSCNVSSASRSLRESFAIARCLRPLPCRLWCLVTSLFLAPQRHWPCCHNVTGPINGPWYLLNITNPAPKRPWYLCNVLNLARERSWYLFNVTNPAAERSTFIFDFALPMNRSNFRLGITFSNFRFRFLFEMPFSRFF